MSLLGLFTGAYDVLADVVGRQQVMAMDDRRGVQTGFVNLRVDN
jgi:hypothetical protein